jgi:putative membrane protein
MKRFFAIAGLAAVLAAPMAASAQTAAVSAQDKTFLTENQQTNLAEITLGKAVAARATDQAVKDYANHVMTDHQEVSQKNMDLAQRLGVTLPTEPNATQKAMAQKVLQKSGAAFDLAYIKGEIDGHDLSISQTNKEISSGSNADVKASATEYLPKAQEHREMAQTLTSQLSAETARTTQGTDALPRTGTDTSPLIAVGALLVVAGMMALNLGRRTSGRPAQFS